MTRIERVEREVLELSPAELVAFRDWFAAREADAWDQQFEEDAEAGKFDALAHQARQDRANGLMTEL